MLSRWVISAVLGVVVVAVSADVVDQHFNDNVANITCSHLGKEYKYGEKIETPDKQCFHCTCRADWVEPGITSCAIIDCPWHYYRTKPHCNTEYIRGQCCPELRCSAAPPDQDFNYITGKRSRASTHGYNITVELGSEMTIYCVADNSTGNVSGGNVTWSLSSKDSEKTLANDSQTKMGFFPPATWALFIENVTAHDDGVYTCAMPTNPIQIQTTRLIVRIDPRPPVIDDICMKPAFNIINNTECPTATEELPWYYSTVTGDCTQHTALSCSWAKENHFATMGACWDHCLDDCYAFAEPGPCRAEMTRYHYDSGSDKCSPFTYGGCQGNRNNFQSIEECEDKCARIRYRSIHHESTRPPPVYTTCTQDCPWNEWLHYFQQGCLAVYDDGSCCPSRFDCNASKDDPHLGIYVPGAKCQHMGKSYAAREDILFPEFCLICPCLSDKLDLIGSQCEPLGCNSTEIEGKLAKGCIPIYKTDICCPVDWQCPPKLKTKFRQGETDSLPKSGDDYCSYGGQNYSIGFKLLTGHSKCLNCKCITPPTFTCFAQSCPDPPSESDETLRCKVVYSFPLEKYKCCDDYDCWSVLEKVDVVGHPQTEKEKSVCEKNPCNWHQECLVNYTECHMGDCQRICEECAVPRCDVFSQYVNPVNHCPYCEGLKTPEDACERNDYCPDGTECVVEHEDDCRRGNCKPECFLSIAMIPSEL